ncbi:MULTISPECIES: potassium channel family protein [Leptolyngbya]|jgi:voltage-gated potassium channel|uniref:Putative potassium channel protein n=1 Tax=Leptolyngbya boryana NIES-2135 TaxID=1973484 RepID=A0A1Z4JHJ8_LEPBY|nr:MULTISPECIES: potassium channel protein [Leptolyngbya]BAY56133.1 putative potassium channel protein [Leptolyngbya boryana NIES-2135]MBD1858550.1 potassium channel protein [Leptolyngbya sp. FACHB-1624]MBD2366243.1 potassium channel protein [Leptolyngbya sp. FACHB-161]MBD2372423.1 potassium channel protein [Leptolyngbya sp. FACHB-238]MBD2396846.1 potassium channel protein [Leptolyngbya sp. FACHB-239]
MQSPLRRILTGVIFFLITVLAATGGYILAGWSPLDAIYMVVITVFGVGFGEVQPINTPALKVFTILVIISGTSSAVYAVGGFVQMITEGEINQLLGKRRMTRTIEGLKDHVIICGFGRMGQILAKRLTDSLVPFVVIDNNAERIEQAETLGYLVYTGNATDDTVLYQVGIDRARALTTVLPDDAANVFITLTARELNPKLMIVSRGELPSTEKKLRLAGADQVVLPASISAFRMAHMITHPATLDFFSQGDERATLNELLGQLDIQVDELLIDSASGLIGATIGDIELRGKGTMIIVALRRADGTTVTHPSQSTFLHEGDAVIILGHQVDMPHVMRNLGARRKMRYRGSSRVWKG